MDVVGVVFGWMFTIAHQDDDNAFPLIARIATNFFLFSFIMDFGHFMYEGFFYSAVEVMFNNGLSSDFFAFKAALIISMCGSMIRDSQWKRVSESKIPD